MPHNKVRGILLDADYSTDGKTGYSSVRLYVRTGKGIEALVDPGFHPYFYAVAMDAKKAGKALESAGALDGIKALSVEEVKKENAQNVLKLSFRNTEELTKAREAVKKVAGVIETREFDIPFANRYIIDKGLEPMGMVEAEAGEAGAGAAGAGAVIEAEADAEGGGEENVLETHAGGAAGLRGKTHELRIKSIKALPDEAPEIGRLKIGCFDLETYSPGRFSDPKLDPILMASYADAHGAVVFTNHRGLSGAKNVVVCKDEKQMVEALAEKIRGACLDIIVTYNGDRFDFPYIMERCNKINAEFGIGLHGAKPRLQRRGLDNAAKVQGLVHVDAYQMMQLLARFGVVNLIKFDLESVQESVFGEKKEKIHSEDINKIWDSGSRAELERLATYNAEDSVAARKLVAAYLPLVAELGRLGRHTLYETSRGSASMLVEGLLMARAFRENSLAPNRPKEDEIKQRMMQSYEGGYVKAPVPGLHENIAVLDFRSLYPSIIISHNISSETLNCSHAECKTGANLAPTKDWFCGKQKGFLAGELRGILELRIRLKKEMKSAGRGSAEHAALDARQHALKILLNSCYGYLAYARSRWYSRECARAITAWGRHYVKEVMDKAEKSGFGVLYGDSDSAFLLVPNGKGAEFVKEFVAKVNETLPSNMELELDGIYRRGLFVTKKGGGAAKKRYALIDEAGKLKIVGFEYVRRDWARIAKNTQRSVIEAVLKEGRPEKAVEIVKKAVDDLRKGRVRKSDLVILTGIKKPLREYEAIGPHIAAAQKAIKRGKHMDMGSVVGYIITKGSGSISERAEMEEYVKEGNYDADYYIENQVIPAVIKILAELGYSRDDLVHNTKQQTLAGFG